MKETTGDAKYFGAAHALIDKWWTDKYDGQYIHLKKEVYCV